MDIYTLNASWQRDAVVEGYESFIWTERSRAWGDFVLVLPSNRSNLTRFTPGVRIVQSDSHRVMVIETVEDKTDSEGRSVLTVQGRSLEAILDSRLARNELSDLTTEPKWIIEGFPAAIARTIFIDICQLGELDSGDIIDADVEVAGTVYPVDTIDEPDTSIEYEIEPQTVYTAIKNLSDIYNMAFRLYREDPSGDLYFGVYMGSDRTTQQTTLPAIVFSPDFENLQNTTQLTTDALYKNVAYVISPVGHEVVYSPDVIPPISGFDRKVLFVRADDITDVVPADATARMIQRGTEELARARRYSGFDGEVNQNAQYKYGVDYNLNDLVELQGTSGANSIMQVTEQIFISDKEGERSYPTLSISRFITPGSWDDYNPSEDWDEVNPTTNWDDL